jgi:hypothetical protein
MPQETTIDQWVTAAHPTAAERAITHRFWKDLAGDMQDHTQAFNSGHRGEAHFAFEQDGHLLTVIYGEHLLRILFDERTGKLIYQFVTPKMATFDRESHGVTAYGEVLLDIQSSTAGTSGAARITSSPHINLDTALADGSIWASHNRLVQYLLQKLISPSFDDERFTTPELKN